MEGGEALAGLAARDDHALGNGLADQFPQLRVVALPRAPKRQGGHRLVGLPSPGLRVGLVESLVGEAADGQRLHTGHKASPRADPEQLVRQQKRHHVLRRLEGRRRRGRGRVVAMGGAV